MSTTFSGPVVSAGGFTGDVTGNLTGDVTGDITGDITGLLTGGQKLPVATDLAGDGAIAPSLFNASMSKGSAAAVTLAAPGAAQVGNLLHIITESAQAHVITAASLDGGNTLTWTAAIGNNVVLYARSATAWAVRSVSGVTLSTI